jgi:hypothetical protein
MRCLFIGVGLLAGCVDTENLPAPVPWVNDDSPDKQFKSPRSQKRTFRGVPPSLAAGLHDGLDDDPAEPEEFAALIFRMHRDRHDARLVNGHHSDGVADE